MSNLESTILDDQQKEIMVKKVKKRSIPILTTGIIAYIVFNWVRSAGGMILPSLIDELALTAAQVALFGAMFNYVYAFANLPTGAITDILGARWTMALSYTFIGIGASVFAFSDNFTMMLVGRGLMGLGGAAVYAGLSKATVAWVRAKDYPGINGKIMGLSKIGTLLAATPLALMISSFGRKNSMLLIATIAVAIAFALFFFIRNKPEDVGLISIDEIEGNKTKTPEKSKSPFKGIGKLLLQGQVWLLVLATVGINSSINTIIANWGPTIMTKGLGFETVTTGNIITINTLAGILGAFTLGTIVKKIGLKKAIYIAYGCFGVALLSFVFFLPQLNTIMMGIAYAVMGFGSSYAIAALFALARNMVTNKNYGTTIGLMNFVAWLIGSSVASQMWGLFVDDTFSVGSFQKAIAFQVIILVIGFVSYIFVKDKPIAVLLENEVEEV